jgi:hypothetical protein
MFRRANLSSDQSAGCYDNQHGRQGKLACIHRSSARQPAHPTVPWARPMLGCRDEKEFRSSRTTPAREDLDSQAEPNLRRRKNKMKKTDSFDQQTSIPPLKPGRSELMLRCDRQTPIKQRDQ